MDGQDCSANIDEGLAEEAQQHPGNMSAPDQNDFDFVERPSEDFFCPVTFELLLDPHQTTCCGNHLSQPAVDRIQRDGKPCPVCKEPRLTTMPDKFHRRKVRAVQVRCRYTPSGCEWVGEVGVAGGHEAVCTKRPWTCQYCEFTSSSDAKREHNEQCVKYPVDCPNKCEVGTVPRCDVEKHRAECPLEMVACELADVGCYVRTTRQDLKRHMEESQQQHLLSATLLNLKLTKETIAEKDRQIAEKDHQLANKDHQLAEKDYELTAKDRIIADKDKQLLELNAQFERYQQEFMDTTKVALDHFLGLNAKEFILKNFSECQKEGGYGDWFSDPFDSLTGEYELKLNVETKLRGPYMEVRLQFQSEVDDEVTFVMRLQLLNQLGDYDHHSKEMETRSTALSIRAYTSPCEFITFKKLLKNDGNVQYLKDNCLKFRMWLLK